MNLFILTISRIVSLINETLREWRRIADVLGGIP